MKTLFPPVAKPRGVNTAKKQNIAEKLYVHLEQNRRKYWEDMLLNDLSKNLSTERDSAEIEEENYELIYKQLLVEARGTLLY